MDGVFIDISSRIQDGDFNLDNMIGTINYYHIHDEITTEEREQLIEAARAKAAEALEIDPKAEILALWTAVRGLQDAIAELHGGGGNDYPEFVQPTGALDAYSKGQGVTFNGKHYESLIDNNVWSPETYPAGWQEVQ